MNWDEHIQWRRDSLANDERQLAYYRAELRRLEADIRSAKRTTKILELTIEEHKDRIAAFAKAKRESTAAACSRCGRVHSNSDPLLDEAAGTEAGECEAAK